MRRFANIIGFACTLLLTFQIAANAAEELGAPPPEPAGTILRPVTGDSIRAELTSDWPTIFLPQPVHRPI